MVVLCRSLKSDAGIESASHLTVAYRGQKTARSHPCLNATRQCEQLIRAEGPSTSISTSLAGHWLP